jgi:hypothetical protein
MFESVINFKKSICEYPNDKVKCCLSVYNNQNDIKINK